MTQAVFIHGAGVPTSDGAPWREDVVRSLARLGYEFDEHELRQRIVSPTYTTLLQPNIPVAPGGEAEDLPVLRRLSESAQSAFADRQVHARASLVPGFPDQHVAQRVIRRVASSERAAKAAARKRVPDAALYLESTARRDAVRRLVLTALSDSRGPIVIVSHSLGTAIAFDALCHLEVPVEIAAFVTLGSPLGLPLFTEFLERLAPCLPVDLIGSWVNFYDPDDVVTGGVGLDRAVQAAGGPEVIDVVVENGSVRGNHDSVRYLDQLVVARHLGPVLVPEMAREVPSGLDGQDRELTERAWFDAAVKAQVRARLIATETDDRRRAQMAVADLYELADVRQSLGLSAEADLEPALDAVSLDDGDVLRHMVSEVLRRPQFAPYDLDAGLDRRHAALYELSGRLGIPDEVLLRARTATEEVLGIHARSNRGGTLLLAASVAAVLAGPFAVAGLGAAGGLAGAAAFTSGLATLGGGSMASGLIVTAATSALTTGAAAYALGRMSPDQAIEAVIGLHVDGLVLGRSGRRDEADAVLASLRSLRYESARLRREHDLLNAGKGQGPHYARTYEASDRAVRHLATELHG